VNASIERAAELIAESQNMVALTGAGISTPSGIPDYRSPKSGLWEQAVDMAEIATIFAFRHQPRAFYEWLRPLLGIIRAATPNPAHLALAQLEEAGRLRALITQNIDLLHERAGSRVVYELHGHLRDLVCPACHALLPAGDALDAFMNDDVIPVCRRCHHVMKPSVVLFGELLPRSAIRAAQAAARSADLMLVAGTSLEVAPAGELPQLAQAHGARLILINRGPTRLDAIADVVIRGDVAEVLPLLAAPWVLSPPAQPLPVYVDPPRPAAYNESRA